MSAHWCVDRSFVFKRMTPLSSCRHERQTGFTSRHESDWIRWSGIAQFDIRNLDIDASAMLKVITWFSELHGYHFFDEWIRMWMKVKSIRDHNKPSKYTDTIIYQLLWRDGAADDCEKLGQDPNLLTISFRFWTCHCYSTDSIIVMQSLEWLNLSITSRNTQTNVMKEWSWLRHGKQVNAFKKCRIEIHALTILNSRWDNRCTGSDRV